MYSTKVNNTLVVPNEEGDQAAEGALWLYAPPAAGLATTTLTAIKAAQTVTRWGSTVPLRNYITGIQISTLTLAADAELTIVDGASTVIWRSILRAGALANVPYAVSFYPGYLRSSANSALSIQLSAATTLGVFVSAQGYTGH